MKHTEKKEFQVVLINPSGEFVADETDESLKVAIERAMIDLATFPVMQPGEAYAEIRLFETPVATINYQLIESEQAEGYSFTIVKNT